MLPDLRHHFKYKYLDYWQKMVVVRRGRRASFCMKLFYRCRQGNTEKAPVGLSRFHRLFWGQLNAWDVPKHAIPVRQSTII